MTQVFLNTKVLTFKAIYSIVTLKVTVLRSYMFLVYLWSMNCYLWLHKKSTVSLKSNNDNLIVKEQEHVYF